uniref:Uncharacterized protein n=1 Tax=Santana virus TaxID=1170427 RepID=M1F269_9VIRU|nr:hypothetical protein 2 [Santana virus]
MTKHHSMHCSQRCRVRYWTLRPLDFQKIKLWVIMFIPIIILSFIRACLSARGTFDLPQLSRYRDELEYPNRPNTHPLIRLDFESHLYDGNIMHEFSVHSANAWNMIWGLKCPPGHIVHPIDHHLFSELYVCIAVPHKMKIMYESFKLSSPESNFFLPYGISSGAFASVTVPGIQNYRVLKDEFNDYYLSTVFCLSHYYQTDINGKDKFFLNYTVTDSTITFRVPSKLCKIQKLYNDTFNLGTLPLTVIIESASLELIDSIRDDRGAGCPGSKPFTELPFDDQSLLIYNVTSKGGKGCSAIYVKPFKFGTVTYHINSAISNSPINTIVTILVSVITPIIDTILNLLTNIISSLIDIFESPEFLRILDRLFTFIVNVFVLILQFVRNVIIPKIVDFLYSIPRKYKILSFVTFVLYLKTTKFIYSLCVTAIVGFCMIE